MKIGIVGLGLIGGSLAKAVKNKSTHSILGFDADVEVLHKAMNEKVVDASLGKNNLKECDLVILALYPSATIAFFQNNLEYFKEGAIIVDCAGVKKRICAELTPLARKKSLHFIGGHPMAGIEESGYQHSFSSLFDRATMILCKEDSVDDDACEILKSFFLSIGFQAVNVTNALEHDEVIAYTSQFAHIVSNAFVKSPTGEKYKGFSAGSFKDLTRVAKLNETMWTELFFENREELIRETDVFMESLLAYRTALAENNREKMKELLKAGRIIKEQLE